MIQRNHPPELTAIADVCGSDKGSRCFDAHQYTAFYSFLFEQFRTDHFSMIELGLLRGAQSSLKAMLRIGDDAPSIRMWLEYFPNAHVYGFDLSDFSGLCMERFTFVRGDLSDTESLEKLKAFRPVRIIVDDASHASFHQQLALKELFPILDPGGFYVIEDLHWQPKRYESTLPRSVKTRNVILEYVENRISRLAVSRSPMASIHHLVGNVFIHRGLLSIAGQSEVKMIVLQRKL
jgi:hypothetical protein